MCLKIQVSGPVGAGTGVGAAVVGVSIIAGEAVVGLAVAGEAVIGLAETGEAVVGALTVVATGAVTGRGAAVTGTIDGARVTTSEVTNMVLPPSSWFNSEIIVSNVDGFITSSS
jgi:hypothetical protein